MAADIVLLGEAIAREELEVSKMIPEDSLGRKMLLHTSVRAIDVFYNNHGDADEEGEGVFHLLGYGKALNTLMGSFVDEIGWVADPVTQQVWDWANTFVYRCGKIALATRWLQNERAGLLRVAYDDKAKTFYFTPTTDQVDLEGIDRDATTWHLKNMYEYYSRPKLEKLIEKFPRIQEKMGQLVEVWHGHFIKYVYEDPEIDDYFEEMAYYLSVAMAGWESFPPHCTFGGIKFHDFVDLAKLNMGISLKHKAFCNELIRKEPGIRAENILTITTDKTELVRSISSCLDRNPKEIEILVDAQTMDLNNFEYHTAESGAPSPPYIKLGANLLLRSSAGCEGDCYTYLARELRRRFKDDYFRAVNEREAAFRNDINRMFKEPHYLKTERGIRIKSFGIHTDIDAAVYNRISGTMALFQLKWQDLFGRSTRERRSRISNLFEPAKKWVDKMISWVSSNDAKTIMSALGFDTNQSITSVKLFVVGRNSVHFTGETADDRVAWCTWHQMLQADAEIAKDNSDKLDYLYQVLKTPLSNEEYRGLNRRFSFNLGDYVLTLQNEPKGRSISEVGSQSSR